EGVAGQRREALDVRGGDLALGGLERIAQFKLVECNAKRMNSRIAQPAAAHPSAAQRRQRVRRPLDRRALHVVQDSAYAAHLLAASRPAWSAVFHRSAPRT